MQPLATIPSPAEGVWHLGPVPIRAYALMIIAGIVVAVWLGERRWAARGGTPGAVIDVAVWAVPFGLAGGRIYHVITDWQRYFGADGDPVRALRIWEGGLGIWGAIVLGGVGAWIGCHRRGISVLALGDAIAPGLALAQAIGRWGNWWNQELYGRPLDAWWALEIDSDHRPQLPGTDIVDPRYADVATYHPTFLYESLWCAALAIVVIWAGRRFDLTHGRTFAVYVAGYTMGRFWIEWLRIDEAHMILGLRLNDWTSLVVFAGAVAYLWLARNRTSPESVVVKDAVDPSAPAVDRPEDARETSAAAAAARPEPAPEAESEPVGKAEPEAGSGSEARPEAAGRPEADAEPAPVLEPETGTEPDPVAESVAGPEAEPEPLAEPEPEAGGGSAPEAEAEPVAELESVAEPEPEAGGGSEPVAEPGPEAADEPGAEPVAEAEPAERRGAATGEEERDEEAGSQETAAVREEIFGAGVSKPWWEQPEAAGSGEAEPEDGTGRVAEEPDDHVEEGDDTVAGRKAESVKDSR